MNPNVFFLWWTQVSGNLQFLALFHAKMAFFPIGTWQPSDWKTHRIGHRLHSYPLFCQIFHPLQHCLTISGYSKRSGSSNSMISGFLASALTSVWGSDFSLLTQISPPSGCSCQLNSKKGDLHDPEGLYPYFVNHQAVWGDRIHATLFWRFPKPFWKIHTKGQ